ncbi:NXPE family member 3 [Ictalurus punctatus]|uniref:NXPE family member 3 n=1 Tax=Ictalurus punctatus TaxID=7998 RepID=A0A2D0R6Z0_ICTPU|nr:NXPE family member 3 [Ictalurus punctatus]XP_017325823.1 NXPE family member 3 [Ictalurus punctatus]XP_017325825.1 NXPE family member 3 [Ictalurus punctatus]XP_047011795.1 NXPE family member 3 [Ictalurus punctatus]XP_047011796.1 NXPE family member 3 [Ictalurus punctatus]
MMGYRTKFVVIFILLALSGFMLLISNIKSLENLRGQVIFTISEIQKSVHSVFQPTEILLPLEVNHTYCAHLGQELTAEEAKEERSLLNSIAWPGPLVQGLPVEFSSDPAKSYFVIQGPAEQHVGGQLVVEVHVQNFLGLPKKHGGDFLIARLHSPKLGAGVAGKVHDHKDGNYTVLFPLLWAGVVQVEITMVHPSEAVAVLKRFQKEQPDRVFFKSQFRSGALSDSTECNVCLPLNQKPFCNYTDPLTGEPWYCYKPKILGCDTRIQHHIGGYRTDGITEYDEMFFQRGVNLKVRIPASVTDQVTVLPEAPGQIKLNYTAAGYYYHDTWRPLNGAVMREFPDSAAITQCLRGKILYMFGDSTVRQWFEYLTAFVPEFNTHSPKRVGPFMAVDFRNNILMHFRLHGPPIRCNPVFTSKLRYVANELDRIQGGPDTVVFVSVWAHFNNFPIEMYIRRLRHIRKALVRLLNREPDTLVVIRTPNLHSITPNKGLYGSEWYYLQIDAVLRAMFRGLNVQLLDAWEMTLAHHLPHDMHPPPIIIKNAMNLILSHICGDGKNS